MPDRLTWDGRAEPEEVHDWLEALRERPYGPEYHTLTDLYDERRAPTLREYLEDPDPHVAATAIFALGCCGSAAEDGPRLLAMARAAGPALKELLSTLTELEVPGTVELLQERLAEAVPGTREEIGLLDRLVWLRDGSVADRVMQLVREHGFGTLHGSRRYLSTAVFRVGTALHRVEMADLAVDVGRRMVAIDPIDPPSWKLFNPLRDQWRIYVTTAEAAQAPELVDVYRRVDASPEAVAGGKLVTPVPVSQRPLEEYADRVVPSTWLRVTDSPETTTWPPPKFLGQPDWREEPAWPVTEAGDPLMFYGQLPLPGPTGPTSRTAYIFLDGPDEWEPLGPGNAVVVQPGNACHLPTIPLREGPQEYTGQWDDTYRRRIRRIPHPEIFLELIPSSDPVSWDQPINVPQDGWAMNDDRNWNKIGGTPHWLQGEESPPDDGWAYLAQFTADHLATERADGAECYLWHHPDGRVAFGWQCH